MSNTEQKLNELVDLAFNKLNAGTLLKNVKLSFTNIGMPEVMVYKIVRLAEIKYNESSFYVAI